MSVKRKRERKIKQEKFHCAKTSKGEEGRSSSLGNSQAEDIAGPGWSSACQLGEYQGGGCGWGRERRGNVEKGSQK